MLADLKQRGVLEDTLIGSKRKSSDYRTCR